MNRIDNNVTPVSGNRVSLLGDNYVPGFDEAMRYKGYQDKLYKHRGPTQAVDTVKRRDMLGDALLEAERQRNDPYRMHGINISKRTGDTLGTIYDVLFGA